METVKFLRQYFTRLDTSHVNSCIFMSTTVSLPLPFFIAEEWQPTILT